MSTGPAVTHWIPLISSDAAPAPKRRGKAGGARLDETPGSFVLTTRLPPGVGTDLEVIFEGNTLHVSSFALRRYRKRRLAGQFLDIGSRGFRDSFTLPARIDPAGARASLAKGLLRVEVPKVAVATTSRRVPLDLSPMDRAAEEAEPPQIAIDLEELHDAETGRLDARRFATYLDIPLKSLAGALGRNYTTVQKTPTASALQPDLQRLKRVLEILDEVLVQRGSVLAWWHAPHPDLGNRTPLAVLLEGRLQLIADMLEAALEGTPS